MGVKTLAPPLGSLGRPLTKEPPMVFCSGRPNRSGSGSGSAELTGSVRFGGSAEPRGSVNRTRTEPKHYINPIFY